MTIYTVNLEERWANGEESTEAYVFDSKKNILIANYGTEHVYHCTYKPEINKVQQAIKDPKDSQRHLSGFFIKSVKISEIKGDAAKTIDQILEVLLKKHNIKES